MKKVTIKDIAREAGVSTATVSMVINHKDQAISDATRKRVQTVVRKNHFIPNAMAGSLVTRRTNTIGLIIPDIVNPFFPELARGAEDRARQSGSNVILCNTDEKPDQEGTYLAMLAKKMVDGIIFAHSVELSGTASAYQTARIPIILIDRDWDSENIKGKILVDNTNGAYMAVRHLLDQGYRSILHIAGPLKTQTARDRVEGYRKALAESGITFDAEKVISGSYTTDWGSQAVRSILEDRNKYDKFDAIFCANDQIAIGAMMELKRAGYRVPEQIGIIGFDDIHMASLTDPALTTVRQPSYEMGWKAVDLLLEFLDQPHEEVRKIILDTSLVIRDSSMLHQPVDQQL